MLNQSNLSTPSTSNPSVFIIHHFTTGAAFVEFTRKLDYVNVFSLFIFLSLFVFVVHKEEGRGSTKGEAYKRDRSNGKDFKIFRCSNGPSNFQMHVHMQHT